MFENSSKNSSVSKHAFKKAVEMADVIKQTKSKNAPKNNKELLKKISKYQKQDNNIKKLSTKIDYSTELSRILNDLNRTMGESNLSEAQNFTIKTFLTTIKGLKKSGSTTSAYIVAKNAMIFLMGTMYPSNLDSSNLMDMVESAESSKIDYGVRVVLSEKARLFKPFYNNHIKMNVKSNQDLIKGSYVNRAI
jgi:hypothetical protein